MVDQPTNEDKELHFINKGSVPQELDSTTSFRISGVTERELELQLIVIMKEVLDYYHKQEEKLRLMMKNISLEDHKWGLRFKDYNNLGVSLYARITSLGSSTTK